MREAIVGENEPWRLYAGVELNTAEDEEGSSVNCVGVLMARFGIGNGIRCEGHVVPCVATRPEMQMGFYCARRR